MAIRQDDAILGGGSSDTEFMGPTMVILMLGLI